MKGNLGVRVFGTVVMVSWFGVQLSRMCDYDDQSQFINRVVRKFNMENCKSRSMPCEIL